MAGTYINANIDIDDVFFNKNTAIMDGLDDIRGTFMTCIAARGTDYTATYVRGTDIMGT